MVNKRLNELILLARGERSQNEYALHCGVSSAAITRIIKGDYIPTPETLKKLACKASNGVTYEDLMDAVGYIKKDPTTSELTIPEEYKDIPVAWYGGVKDLTQEDIDDVTRFIEFLRNKHKDEK